MVYNLLTNLPFPFFLVRIEKDTGTNEIGYPYINYNLKKIFKNIIQLVQEIQILTIIFAVMSYILNLPNYKQ